MASRITQRDPRIDAYIEKAAAFAKPILVHLREVVHEGCPDVQETLKWGMPSFEYKGILCGMAAFKQHCVFDFWKHKLVFGEDGPERPSDQSAPKSESGKREAMGDFGRLTKVSDLPSRRVLLKYVKKAVALNDAGVKTPRPPRKAKIELVVPPDLSAGLKKSKKAATHFEDFSYSKKKDYIEWLTGAKSEETRKRRLATALEWIAEGKSRNWKYERC